MLGEDAISTDDEDLHRHGYSEWSSVNIDQLPVAVAYPKSTTEVSELAKVCYRYKIPMSKLLLPRYDQYYNFAVPYSGGTSLEANFSAPYGGMSIDFSFMDQIVELHADESVKHFFPASHS
jgi:D-lactate dehydrogenase (cytochrome)